jgi:hypothetical protein
MVRAGFHQRGGFRPVLCFRCCGVAGEADSGAAGRSSCVAGFGAACFGAARSGSACSGPACFGRGRLRERRLRCLCPLSLPRRPFRPPGGWGRGARCTRCGEPAAGRRRQHLRFRKSLHRARPSRAGLASSPLPLPAGVLLPGGPRSAEESRLHGPGPNLKPPTTGFPTQPDPGSAVLPGRHFALPRRLPQGRRLPSSLRLPRCRRLLRFQLATIPHRCAVSRRRERHGSGRQSRPAPRRWWALPVLPGGRNLLHWLYRRCPQLRRKLRRCRRKVHRQSGYRRRRASFRPARRPHAQLRDFLAVSRHQTTPASTTSRMIKKTASMAIPSVGLASSFARRYVGSTALSSTLTCRDVLFRRAVRGPSR